MNTTYQDIGFSFDSHPATKDFLKTSDVNSVKSWLKHLFKTNQGEDPFEPDFGLGLEQLVFENFSPVLKTTLLRRIKEQVAFYVPECVLQEVIIDTQDDGENVNIDVRFYVLGNPQSQSFFYKLERTR